MSPRRSSGGEGALTAPLRARAKPQGEELPATKIITLLEKLNQ
jgi:hypothetical protein